MANWYTIYTSPGSEENVKEVILSQARKEKISADFEEIIIPVTEILKIKCGKPTMVKKKVMSGYILVKMNMTDRARNIVNSIPKTSFLGSKSNPTILSEKEVQEIINRISSTSNSHSTQLYEIGEQVTVIEGIFESLVGVIEEINNDKQRLRISVSIFGKATPIDLDFDQVKKT